MAAARRMNDLHAVAVVDTDVVASRGSRNEDLPLPEQQPIGADGGKSPPHPGQQAHAGLVGGLEHAPRSSQGEADALGKLGDGEVESHA